MDSSSRALAALRDQLRVTLASLMPQAETMMINEKFREAETLFLRACRGARPRGSPTPAPGLVTRPHLRRDLCARAAGAADANEALAQHGAQQHALQKAKEARTKQEAVHPQRARMLARAGTDARTRWHGCTLARARTRWHARTHARARTRWLAGSHACTHARARARTQVDKTKREANELMDLSVTLVATHNFDLAREKIKKAVQLFSTIHESQAVQNAQSSMLDIDRRATQCAIF
jgi:hypothetical protein